MIALALAVRHARLAAVAAALDAAEAGGRLRVYAAPRPVVPCADTDATLLVEARLPRPCWTGIANGVLRFDAPPDTLALRSGTPAWARLADGEGRFVADLDAGPPGSGAELEIDPPLLHAGGTVHFALAELTEP